MAEGLLGRTLLGGEYQLTGILGRGGMATVYRAYSRSLETDVAVKVLAPRLARDPGFRERHHDEARSLAQLHHPNLVEVHHYGEEDDLVYIVMRLVPGGTLKNRLEALDAPLGLVTTARLIRQVADALQLAHGHGLVHLDIKPANILLGRSDWPLLADFGITRAVKTLQSAAGQQRMAGTPLYMSPEQCQGGPVDGRSDQYSLAITTYELLTGRRPFQAETTEALLQHQIEDLPPRPREVNPGIPGPVEDVLLRALSKSPDERFPTIREFATALVDAAERTQGVSLETKAAVAGIAPNAVAIVVLLALGPLLFSLLPGSALLGPGIPLAWPFQLVVSLLVAGLLIGIRWHLIGLISRGLALLLDTVRSGGGYSVSRDGGLTEASGGRSLRNAVLGSVEGIVNLAYLFVIYRLFASPLLAIVGAIVDSSWEQAITTGVSIVFVLLALGTVVAIYRSGGAAIAGVSLGLCWAFAGLLPSTDVASGGSFAWPIRALVGAGVVGILLATRGRIQAAVRHFALALLGPLVVEIHGEASPKEVSSARDNVAKVVAGAVDFFYLLVGYALVRTPVTHSLEPLIGVASAAILVSGFAFLIWLLLILRLRAAAGASGFLLGLLLGAPLLVSLPVFESSVLGAAWPATVATWVVGTVFILVLAAIRGPVQTVGQTTLGPMLDRGLLGAQTARTEEHADRRVGALGALGDAFLDVFYLVLAYWVLSGPAATAIGTATGKTSAGSLFLVALVVGAIALLIGPVHHALATIEETGGPRWFSRLRALPSVAVALVALLVGGCAAAPMALAAPDVAGGLAMSTPPASTVIVDWEHWVPWIPTRQDATFDISLSCPDGRSFGQFREVFHPASGDAMPSGNVGTIGPTNASCDHWTDVYFARRRAAGLPATPSVSLDWLAVKVTILPGGAADVVETHREVFTEGNFNHLSWSLGPRNQNGQISGLQIEEDGTSYPLNPSRPGDRYARTFNQNDQTTLDWWFPPVSSPAVRIYTIKYRLSGVVVSNGTDGRFERLVLPPSRLGPAWQTTVEVVLPTAVRASDVRLGANGAPARFGLANGRIASFAAQDVPNGTGLDVFVDFPMPGRAAVATRTPTTTPTPNLTAPATAAPPSSPTPILSASATPAMSPTETARSTAQAASPTATTTATPVAASPTVTVTSTPVAASPTATTAPVAKTCATVPVLAMYYNWYDQNTWTSGKTSDQPVSPYVSADRATIERQVTEAQGAGIDGFEVNWWGPGNQTDTNLPTLLAVAGSHGFKVTVDFDLNSPFVHSASDITKALMYLQRYYGNPAWFHYDGKPYIVFYGTRRYDTATWASILHQVDPNHQVLWIAEGDIFSYLTVFDGIHPYSVAWSPDPSSQLASYASRTRAYPNKIWMATVMPGYNDKLVNGAQGFSVDRQNGAYYTSMWQGAMATHPDIVSITSFNEWVEGSQMEPSKTYGNLYLDLTRQMVAKYHAQLAPCG